MRWLGVISMVILLGIIFMVMRTSPKTVKVVASSTSSREFGEDAQSCVGRLRAIGMGIAAYAVDHDQHLPGSTQWANDIGTYLANKDPLSCPKVGQYGYAYHQDLSGIKMSKVSSPGSTIYAFDSSNLVPNANDNLTSLPSPGRHHDRSGGPGNMAVFADGRVNWAPR